MLEFLKENWFVFLLLIIILYILREVQSIKHKYMDTAIGETLLLKEISLLSTFVEDKNPIIKKYDISVLKDLQYIAYPQLKSLLTALHDIKNLDNVDINFVELQQEIALVKMYYLNGKYHRNKD